MNYLRVILATLVIFATGAISGYLVAGRHSSRAPAVTDAGSMLAGTNAPAEWNKRRDEMRTSLQEEIKASDEQMAKVDEILAASRKRTREIWQTIKIPLEDEVNRVKEEIRGVLNEEQAVKYEEIMKRRGKFGPGGGRDKPEKKDGGSQACRPNGRSDRQCFL